MTQTGTPRCCPCSSPVKGCRRQPGRPAPGCCQADRRPPRPCTHSAKNETSIFDKRGEKNADFQHLIKIYTDQVSISRWLWQSLGTHIHHLSVFDQSTLGTCIHHLSVFDWSTYIYILTLTFPYFFTRLTTSNNYKQDG